MLVTVIIYTSVIITAVKLRNIYIIWYLYVVTILCWL